MSRHVSVLLFAVSISAALVLSAFADEVLMKGPQILSTLKGARVFGEDWSQSFADGGSTIYFAEGKQSIGRWDVRGDEYCSLWPPSEVWNCYAMTNGQDKADVIWIAADGARTYGHLIPKGQ